jgi:hypothetical protein
VLAPLALEAIPAYTLLSGGATLSMLGQILLATALAIAALWLCAGLLPPSRRFSAWLLAMLVLAVWGLLAYLPLLGLKFTLDTEHAMMIINGLGLLTFLGGFIPAGWVCRRHFGGLRFLLTHLLGMVACFMICTIVVFTATVGVRSFGRFPWQLLFIIPIYGLVFWAMTLPFLILALASGFYRARLVALVGPRAASPPRDGGMNDDTAPEPVLAAGMKSPD